MNVAMKTEQDDAWIATFEASRSRLFSLAYRILGVRADAEDVVQDTFVKWHLQQRAGGGVDTPVKPDTVDTPAAWLTTVARRTAIDYLRRAAQESRLLDESDARDPAPSPQMLAEQMSDLSYGMRRVLDRLSDEERAAFLLREAFDKDYASIARILNRSAVHCRQIVHRAKDRVRDDRRRIQPDAAPSAIDAVEPILDAIARQDVHALVGLIALSPVPTPAISASARAAVMTHALIVRLRLGHTDLRFITDAVRDPVSA